MNPRVAALLVGVLATVCAGLVLSVAYPITTTEPLSDAPPEERFDVPEDDTYAASGSIVVDGDVQLAFEGAVGPDGEWHQHVKHNGVTVDRYSPGANGSVYERIETGDEQTAQQRREHVESDDDRELLREKQTDGGAVLVVEQISPDSDDPVAGTTSVFVRSLHTVSYESTDNPAEAVYEPRTGWYDGPTPYRITNATGSVRTDAETHTVETATVTWEMTEPAGTYAEYLVSRLTGDDPTQHHVTVDIDSGESEIERPDWLDEQ